MKTNAQFCKVFNETRNFVRFQVKGRMISKRHPKWNPLWTSGEVPKKILLQNSKLLHLWAIWKNYGRNFQRISERPKEFTGKPIGWKRLRRKYILKDFPKKFLDQLSQELLEGFPEKILEEELIVEILEELLEALVENFQRTPWSNFEKKNRSWKNS